MARCPGKSRQTQERQPASLPDLLIAIHTQREQQSPAKKATTTFGQLQVIDSNFADPEIAVMRAAELHRSPPIAVSMLSGTLSHSWLFDALGSLTCRVASSSWPNTRAGEWDLGVGSRGRGGFHLIFEVAFCNTFSYKIDFEHGRRHCQL